MFRPSVGSDEPTKQSTPKRYFNFNWPYRRDFRRRTMALFDAFLRFRVAPPLANLPEGLTGCLPPLVRPSPPPCG